MKLESEEVSSVEFGCELITARNGWIVRHTENGTTAEGPFVFQQRDGWSHSDDVHGFVDLLHHLNEHFGPCTSRYSEERVKISIEQGDKYEGPEQRIDYTIQVNGDGTYTLDPEWGTTTGTMQDVLTRIAEDFQMQSLADLLKTYQPTDEGGGLAGTPDE